MSADFELSPRGLGRNDFPRLIDGEGSKAPRIQGVGRPRDGDDPVVTEVRIVSTIREKLTSAFMGSTTVSVVANSDSVVVVSGASAATWSDKVARRSAGERTSPFGAIEVPSGTAPRRIVTRSSTAPSSDTSSVIVR